MIMKHTYIFIFFLLSFLFSSAQETFKLMSYNLHDFGCGFSLPENYIEQTKYLKVIIENQAPDVLAVCEISPDEYYASYILNNSLNSISNRWAKTEVTKASKWGCDDSSNCLFYDSIKFIQDTIIEAFEPVTGLGCSRHINIYRLKHRKSGVHFYFCIAHLKASEGVNNENRRAGETKQFMNWLEEYHDNKNNFIIMGDFNFYKDEQGYTNLINPANNKIAFYDPIIYDSPSFYMSGNWTNINYSNYHTHSVSKLQRRFDLILINSSLLSQNGNAVNYIQNSYKTIGNDGDKCRFQKSLIDSIACPPNTSLPRNVINSLYNMSDHLPVVAEFYIGQMSTTETSITDDFVANLNNTMQGKLDYEIKSSKSCEITIKIISASGITVYTEKISVKQNKKYISYYGDLATGLYIVTFEGKNIFKSYKIIIN